MEGKQTIVVKNAKRLEISQCEKCEKMKFHNGKKVKMLYILKRFAFFTSLKQNQQVANVMDSVNFEV